jgi:hypothetical protein
MDAILMQEMGLAFYRAGRRIEKLVLRNLAADC